MEWADVDNAKIHYSEVKHMTTADKIRKYCSYQDRSEQEVRRKMSQLLVPHAEADELMTELLEEKFVDDNRFAENFIRGKVNIKRWGRVKIKVELLRRGISIAIVQEKMAEIDEQQYAENLHYLIQKWRSENPQAVSDKLFCFLMQKGYEPGEISSAIHKN